MTEQLIEILATEIESYRTSIQMQENLMNAAKKLEQKPTPTAKQFSDITMRL